MKHIANLRFTIYALIAIFAFTLSALAQLTVSVTPGYRLNNGEKITIEKLNLLGAPTVEVAGTVTGSSLAAGGVSAVNVNTNATDQLTVLGGYDGSATTLLRVSYNTNTLGIVAGTLGVKTNGIGSNQLATASVNSNHIAAGSITPALLSSTFTVATNQLPTGATNRLLWANTNGTWQYVSLGAGLGVSNATLIASNLSSSATLTFTNPFPYLTPIPWTNAHGLGRHPGDVRVVFQCLSNIGIWQTGDEVDAENATTGSVFKYGSCSVNATNVRVALYNHSGMSVVTSDATISGLTTNYWRMKIYVTP